ncbi:hypothetical protein ETAA8_50600 [Anatilimnocola aggregata]|uniref:Uncharacterized protein n=1 Tax=Anatilimnocola aggregata TaxID=2528021 RepID=A0A517YIA1_9BACT|nr:hypothetical protein [Anatilimnocola aggregata]QDU29942.1 hypothetical protein ETAA8_50600 [Anatilimnocola aggregata]
MHAVRLRGPWQIEPLARFRLSSDGNIAEETTNLPAATTTDVPADWGHVLGNDFVCGRVRYTRRFGLPTNLSPEERVSLVIERLDWQGTIELNGQVLGDQLYADGLRTYEITALLKFRNLLQIVVELPAVGNAGGSYTDRHIERAGREHLPGGLIGEVRLEIA